MKRLTLEQSPTSSPGFQAGKGDTSEHALWAGVQVIQNWAKNTSPALQLMQEFYAPV
jgi:hypothetical protein